VADGAREGGKGRGGFVRIHIQRINNHNHNHTIFQSPYKKNKHNTPQPLVQHGANQADSQEGELWLSIPTLACFPYDPNGEKTPGSKPQQRRTLIVCFLFWRFCFFLLVHRW
jgi:hypothetical protein